MGEGAARTRVLLIDDNSDDEELYTAGLKMEDFEVECVRRIEELAPALETTQAQVIVFHLNGVFTWNECERVCQMTQAPLVLLTSHVRPDGANRAQAKRLNVAAFVGKPAAPRGLAQVLRRVLGGERGLEITSFTGRD